MSANTLLDLQRRTMDFGAMFGHEIAQAVVITVAGTYVMIGGSLGDGLITGAKITFQNARELLWTGEPASFFVVWSVSVSPSLNNHDLSGCVMKNAVAQTQTANHAFAGVGVSKNISLGSSGGVTVVSGDVLRLSLTDHTAPATLTVEHANLTVLRIL